MVYYNNIISKNTEKINKLKIKNSEIDYIYGDSLSKYNKALKELLQYELLIDDLDYSASNYLFSKKMIKKTLIKIISSIALALLFIVGLLSIATVIPIIISSLLFITTGIFVFENIKQYKEYRIKKKISYSEFEKNRYLIKVDNIEIDDIDLSTKLTNLLNSKDYIDINAKLKKYNVMFRKYTRLKRAINNKITVLQNQNKKLMDEKYKAISVFFNEQDGITNALNNVDNNVKIYENSLNKTYIKKRG